MIGPERNQKDVLGLQPRNYPVLIEVPEFLQLEKKREEKLLSEFLRKEKRNDEFLDETPELEPSLKAAEYRR